MFRIGQPFLNFLIFFEGDAGDGGGGDAGKSADDGNAGTGGGEKGLMETANEDAGNKDEQNPAGDDKKPDEGKPPADGEPAKRPDYIPEKFWDTKAGMPRLEQMAKSYEDSQKELNRLKTKGQDGKVPETAEDYVADWKMPEIERGEGDDRQALDRVREFGKDDPVLLASATVAKKVRMPKAMYDEFVTEFLYSINGELPVPFDMEAEIEKMGGAEKADSIIKTNNLWLNHLAKNGVLNEDQHLKAMQFGADALGVEVINKLRELSGEKPIPLNASANEGAKSRAELQAMVADPRYNQQDAAGEAFRAEYEKQMQISRNAGLL